MKMIIALAALVAVAMAAPQQTRDGDITIVKEIPLNNNGQGDWKYGYELSNGAKKEESARLVPAEGPEEEPSYKIVGSYSYVDPKDGLRYEIKYTAGKEGFLAEADHLPK